MILVYDKLYGKLDNSVSDPFAKDSDDKPPTFHEKNQKDKYSSKMHIAFFVCVIAIMTFVIGLFVGKSLSSSSEQKLKEVLLSNDKSILNVQDKKNRIEHSPDTSNTNQGKQVTVISQKNEVENIPNDDNQQPLNENIIDESKTVHSTQPASKSTFKEGKVFIEHSTNTIKSDDGKQFSFISQKEDEVEKPIDGQRQQTNNVMIEDLQPIKKQPQENKGSQKTEEQDSNEGFPETINNNNGKLLPAPDHSGGK